MFFIGLVICIIGLILIGVGIAIGTRGSIIAPLVGGAIGLMFAILGIALMRAAAKK